MHYLERSYQDGSLIKKIFIEVNNEGFVTREVELDSTKKQIIHKFPSNGFKNGTYGFFDNIQFELKGLKEDLTKEDFEILWNRKS